MRNAYPQFAIETLRYVADRRGWMKTHRLPPIEEIAIVTTVVMAIGGAEVLPADAYIKAAVAMARRRDIKDADWLEAASLVSAIASRSPMTPTEIDQRRARALHPVLAGLALYFRD